VGCVSNHSLEGHEGLDSLAAVGQGLEISDFAPPVAVEIREHGPNVRLGNLAVRAQECQRGREITMAWGPWPTQHVEERDDVADLP